MKMIFVLMLIGSFLNATTGYAGEALKTYDFEAVQSLCYGKAMIGYDSTINHRVGLPIEKAVFGEPFFDEVVYEAYQWTGDSHEFSQRVFHKCILAKVCETFENDGLGVPGCKR